MASDSGNSPAGNADVLCVICQSPIGSEDVVTACPDCGTAYHAECWEANQGCGVYGCASAPSVANLEPVEIPVSYWGQERKQCPRCGADILAAAVRCRECGTVFRSARPEQEDEYKQRVATEENLPSIRRGAVWLFVWSVLPFTAPFAAAFGTAWWRRHRAEIEELPAIHASLAHIGVIIAMGQTAFLVVAAFLYTVVNV